MRHHKDLSNVSAVRWIVLLAAMVALVPLWFIPHAWQHPKPLTTERLELRSEDPATAYMGKDYMDHKGLHFMGDALPSPEELSQYKLSHSLRQIRNSADKILLLYCPAGWGNSYFAILHSLMVAIVTERALVIHFPKANLTPALLPGHIDWRPWSSITVESRPQWWNFPHVKDWNQTHIDKQKAESVLHISYFPGIFSADVAWWSPFFKEQARARGLDLDRLSPRRLLDFVFEISPALEVMAQDVLRQLQPKGDEGYLALHIRTGRGEKGLKPIWTWFVDPEEALRELPRYAEAARKEAGLDSSAKWLVATDDPCLGQAFLEQHPSNVVLSNPHLTLASGLHISSSNEEGLMLTFLDWILLIRSAVILQAGTSTFSSSAISYSGAQCKNVASISSSVDNSPLPINVCHIPRRGLDRTTYTSIPGAFFRRMRKII